MVRTTRKKIDIHANAAMHAGSSTNAAAAIVNPPKSAAASGLVESALEGQDEDGDEDDDERSGADLKSGAHSDGEYQRWKAENCD